MVKVIAYREGTWLHPNADKQQWRHLCRAFSVELQLIDDWAEAVVPVGTTVVLIDEQGETSLQEFSHPENAVYVFGKTHMNPVIAEGDQMVRIDTPKPVCLFGVVACAIVLGDRTWR